MRTSPPLQNPCKILDFGCNTGILLHYLHQKYGYDGAGVEINSHAEKLAIEKLGVSCYSDISLIPDEIKFDIITLIDVIEHVPEPCSLISMLSNKLNENGIIFLRLPIIDGMLFRREHPEQWKLPIHPIIFQCSAEMQS
ncbi:class I SAM-dependent methyltransferase [Deltaproteobacteria bacterium TL4]